MQKFLPVVGRALTLALLLIAASPAHAAEHSIFADPSAVAAVHSRAATVAALHLSAPGLLVVESPDPDCKQCVRSPAPMLEDPPLSDSIDLQVTPAGGHAPILGKITGKVVWPAYGHGEPGQCSFGGCATRTCKWVGDIVIHAEAEMPAQIWDVAVYWDSTLLSAFSLNSGGNRTIALNKGLPCEVNTNQVPLEVRVTVNNTVYTVINHMFVCNGCTSTN